MIDFYWTGCTVGLSAFFVLLFLVYVVIFYRQGVKSPNWRKKKPDFMLILFSLILILVVAASDQSDWFSYQRFVWSYTPSYSDYQHSEPVYGYIVQFVNSNYMMFRIIVWGGAFLLTCLTFKRYTLNLSVGIFFIIAVYLLTFNYARATLGMASYFYGLSFILKPIKNSRIVSLLLMALFFFAAYSFHHSMVILIALTPVVFLPIDRPFIIIPALFLLPLLAAVVQGSFELAQSFQDEDIASKFEMYEGVVKRKRNLFGMLRYFIEYGSFYFPIIVSTVVIAKKRKIVDKSILSMSKVVVATTILSASFLFMGYDNMIFFYRVLYMTMIPISVIIIYLYQKHFFNSNTFSWIIIWGILSNLYPLLYAIYFIRK